VEIFPKMLASPYGLHLFWQHSASFMSTHLLPFERSYWVAAGRLLAGAYPGDASAVQAERKLAGLIGCGVGLVINLMYANEVNQSGVPFVDYRPVLEALAQRAGRAIRCSRLPIRDYDVPAVAHMRNILDTIDAASASGEIVYVHCWGGKGRTGTVIGCYLARHELAVGEAALVRLNELAKAASYDFGSVPQTPAQCEFVQKWEPQE
jgi:hypothetical protein